MTSYRLSSNSQMLQHQPTASAYKLPTKMSFVLALPHYSFTIHLKWSTIIHQFRPPIVFGANFVSFIATTFQHRPSNVLECPGRHRQRLFKILSISHLHLSLTYNCSAESCLFDSSNNGSGGRAAIRPLKRLTYRQPYKQINAIAIVQYADFEVCAANN